MHKETLSQKAVTMEADSEIEYKTHIYFGCYSLPFVLWSVNYISKINWMFISIRDLSLVIQIYKAEIM